MPSFDKSQTRKTMMKTMTTATRSKPALAYFSGFYKKGCQEKKLRLDRRREDFVSRRPAHCCKCAPRFDREVLLWLVCDSLWGSFADGDNANRVWKLWQARPGVSSVHHGSIGGSRPIAISGETRGHSVKRETRCRSTQGLTH